MYRNSEGYADPTAGAAFAAVGREEKRKRSAEMLRAAELILRHKDVTQIAAALGRTREYTYALLRDMLNIMNRATKEMK